MAIVLWGRSAGAGVYLYRDFVTVPEPAAPRTLVPETAAALRAWPLDAVMWAASTVLPAGVVQYLLLVGVVLLAGVGAGVLVSPWGRAAAVTAAVLATWNPHVAERLLLGQAPTLLAYAAAPWIVVAARSRRRPRVRLPLVALAIAPAALTPWGGLVALVTAVAGSWSRHRFRRETVTAAAIGVLWCLPWAVPALLAEHRSADPDGAAAFALRDDTGRGLWWSALTGGGVWAEPAALASREEVIPFTAAILLLALAVAGALTVCARWGPRWLALALLVGPATVATWASTQGLDLVTWLQGIPGAALFRDQHRVLGLAVLTQAVLIAALVGRLRRVLGPGTVLIAATIGALVVTASPDLASRLARDYRPVVFPEEWAQVLGPVAADPDAVVLSLPWQPLRRTPWAGPTSFLDPTTRAVRGRVLVSSELRVPRGDRLHVVDEAPVAEEADWSAGRVSAESLAAHEVTHVLLWRGTPGARPTPGPTWVELVRTPQWVLWEVSGGRT